MMSNAFKCTSSTYSAARGLDIVPRLIAFVLCFYIAITPAVVYASAAPKLDFIQIQNFVRTAGAASADYLFKRPANDPTHSGAANDSFYKTPKHSVSNAKLGKVGFSRILKLSPVSIVGGLVVAELISKLTEQGWIIDPVAHEMYKIDPNPPLMDISFSATTIHGVNCHGSTPESLVSCLSAAQAGFGITTRLNPNPNPWSPPLNTLSSGEQSTSAAFYINDRWGNEHSVLHAGAVSLAPAPGDRKIMGTEADVAAILPEISDAGIAELMVSSDYLAEPHAPTIDAAAAAQPETTTTAEPQKATLGTKTETTTQTNPDGSKTTTTTTTPLNPDGTPATNPDGTPKTPHVQTTTTNPDGSTTTTTNGAKPSETEPPAFCDWAKTVCDWIGWTKEAPAPPAGGTAVVVGEVSESDVLPNFDISQQRVVFASSCPAGIPIHFSMMGSSVDTTFSYQPLCDFMAALKPFVIASAYITGAYIISGVGRGGGNNG